MTQHASLTPERWQRFSLDQQILMIGNEMNRAQASLRRSEVPSFRLGCERILRLTDLTVQVNERRPLRRELLRWRDLIAELYIAPEPSLTEHREAFRALLMLSGEASRQIPFVLGSE